MAAFLPVGHFHWGKGPQKFLGIFFLLPLKALESPYPTTTSSKEFLQNKSVKKKNISPSLKVTQNQGSGLVKSIASKYFHMESNYQRWYVSSFDGFVVKQYYKTEFCILTLKYTCIPWLLVSSRKLSTVTFPPFDVFSYRSKRSEQIMCRIFISGKTWSCLDFSSCPWRHLPQRRP